MILATVVTSHSIAPGGILASEVALHPLKGERLAHKLHVHGWCTVVIRHCGSRYSLLYKGSKVPLFHHDLLVAQRRHVTSATTASSAIVITFSVSFCMMTATKRAPSLDILGRSLRFPRRRLGDEEVNWAESNPSEYNLLIEATTPCLGTSSGRMRPRASSWNCYMEATPIGKESTDRTPHSDAG